MRAVLLVLAAIGTPCGIAFAQPIDTPTVVTEAVNAEKIANSPQAAREFIGRLCQRLCEADDRIVNGEKIIGRADGQSDADAAAPLPNSAYLAAKTAWLQRQLRTRCALGERSFLVGRRPAAGEGLARWQPDLQLDDAAPFRVSRNHFVIEKSDLGYLVRDLGSALGTIVNGAAIISAQMMFRCELGRTWSLPAARILHLFFPCSYHHSDRSGLPRRSRRGRSSLGPRRRLRYCTERPVTALPRHPRA